MDTSQIDLLFYTDQVSGTRACLTTEEMHHAIHVLRRKVGDEIHFTDGKGMLYLGRITEITKKEAWLDVVTAEQQKRQPYQISIAVSPTKSFDRMEWCVEKLTEMGVQRIIPMLCTRAERKKWNQERIRKIAISAMKQSKRAYLPDLAEPMQLRELIQDVPSGMIKYIAVLDYKSVPASVHYKSGSDVLILIGPEGDFTNEEITMATQADFVPLTLGDFRLRTETAAMMAAATIQTLNQK